MHAHGEKVWDIKKARGKTLALLSEIGERRGATREKSGGPRRQMVLKKPEGCFTTLADRSDRGNRLKGFGKSTRGAGGVSLTK